jgi:hypothetical protein
MYNANCKHQIVPFHEGDFIYLSTKNIKFDKGLACKLIPKYIGPYRLLKDCGNYLFLVDIPEQLKQRGMHPIFHLSLMRIHHPNDNRLFPGCLDNQIGLPEKKQGK